MRQLATKAALTALLGLALLGPQTVMAQNKPYTDGTVWSVSFIKTRPGMADVYLKDLSVKRKALMDAAKKQGLIVSEKILVGGGSMGRDDWDLMLMVEYKNWAAFDGLSDKFDALALKVVGSEEAQIQTMIKRTETREIMGEKVFQEIHFK